MTYKCAEHGYDFDKEKLLEYNHMSFGEPPITVESVEEANELMRKNEEESSIGKNISILLRKKKWFEFLEI